MCRGKLSVVLNVSDMKDVRGSDGKWKPKFDILYQIFIRVIRKCMFPILPNSNPRPLEFWPEHNWGPQIVW